PVARLAEFESALSKLPATGPQLWHLSALAGPDVAVDARSMTEFNRRHAGAEGSTARALIDSVEIKASAVPEIAGAKEALPPGFQAYFELPLTSGLDALIDEVARPLADRRPA